MFALISVFNKAGIVDLASSLVRSGHSIIATGKTFTTLCDAGIQAVEVSSITKFPEILGGRVKTLHPQVFGGILANRAEPSHQQQCLEHGLPDIRVVVANLYPFWEIADQTAVTDETAVELIDIGGVSLIRAAAKNFSSVAVLTDPSQYADFSLSGADLSRRRALSRSAFQMTAAYDANIAKYFDSDVESGTIATTRRYELIAPLKYGCNPHQTPAGIYSIDGRPSPLKLLHGSWSYINVLDALNAWGLVTELAKQFPGKLGAASFKHTSPAGAALELRWDELSTQSQQMLSTVYGLSDTTTRGVLTYARARNADPQSSFGDFIGFNGVVDEELATFLAAQISDGIIASGYTPKALDILSSKKKGSFVVIEGSVSSVSSHVKEEFREIGGVALSQPQNNVIFGSDHIVDKLIPTRLKEIPACSRVDLIVANIAMKFAQSNNVACAFEGQLIGLAAGQQSRIDAVKLVSRKVKCWLNRHNADIMAAFNGGEGSSRQQRIMDTTAMASEFTGEPEWKPDISFASDAFLPFSDNIDELAKLPIKYITQAGGSVRDGEVIEACNRHGICMSMTGLRIFTH